MAMIKCTNCGKEISDKAKACPSCGKTIEVTLKDETIEKNDLDEIKGQDHSAHNSSMNDQKSSTDNKSRKKAGIIIALIAGVVIIAGGLGVFFYYNNVVKPANAYKEAEALLNEKKYAEAQQKFNSLGDYEDSAEKIIECDYLAANDDLVAGNYDSAKEAFGKIVEYKDSTDKIKECDYQKALDLYNEGDYKNAVVLFSSIYTYSDSKKYVYKVYKKYGGQDFIDEFSNGLGYLSSYIDSQSSALLTFAFSSYLGTSSSDSWSPDMNDKDLKSMEQSMTNLNTKMTEFSDIFSQEVINNCKDEKLSTAYEQFNDVHDSAANMLSRSKAITYITEISQGSTATMEKDTSDASTAISTYKETVNSMKTE